MAVVVAADGRTATSRGGLNGFNINTQVTTPAISAPPTIRVNNMRPRFRRGLPGFCDCCAGPCQSRFRLGGGAFPLAGDFQLGVFLRGSLALASPDGARRGG